MKSKEDGNLPSSPMGIRLDEDLNGFRDCFNEDGIVSTSDVGVIDVFSEELDC
jgi:hypothetical protein